MANTKVISVSKKSGEGGGGGYYAANSTFATNASFKNLNASNARIENSIVDEAEISKLVSNDISTTILSAAASNMKTASIDDLDVNEKLTAPLAELTEIKNNALLESDHVEAEYAGIKKETVQDSTIDFAQIRELIAKDITTDNLNVLKSAHFFELIIDKIKACGGALIISPADGFELYGHYTWDSLNYTYLYWLCENNGKSIDNMWQVNDQALCQNFNQVHEGVNNNVGNRYWWGKVLEVSTNSTTRWCTRNETSTASVSYIGDSTYNTYHPTLRKSDFTLIDGAGYAKNDGTEVKTIAEYEALDSTAQADYTLTTNIYYCPVANNDWIYITSQQYNGTVAYEGYYIKAKCKADYKKCHWIRVSHTYADPNSTFEFSIGDNVVMLGNQTDTTRQSAIYISAYKSLDSGLTAPLIAQYRGINDFNLSTHRKSYFDANSAEFYGRFKVQSDGPDDGTDVLDHLSTSPLMVTASNMNINIPCDSTGAPLSNTTTNYGTDLHIMYGTSEQNITSYVCSYTSTCVPSFSYSGSTAHIQVPSTAVSAMAMVEPIEVTLGCQYGQEKTTVTFNKIIPGQDGVQPEVYELTFSDTIVKREAKESLTISVGLSKYGTNGWETLTHLESTDYRIIYKRSNSTQWYGLAASTSTTLPKDFTLNSTNDWVTFKLMKKAGASWDTSNDYAADTILDTQTVMVVQDGKDGQDGQDGTGTSGEAEKVLWQNKQLIVNAAGTVTIDLLGQLQYVIGATVQETHDWTNYSINIIIPEIHASWGSEVYFDNSTTTSSGKFHTGNTGDWDVSAPTQLMTNYFVDYASSLPDRAILTVKNGNVSVIEESIPLIFKAGAVMDIVDDRIQYAVLDSNGSLANVVVTADNIDQMVRDSDSWTQINQRADEIVLRLKDTGIDIVNENININANNTNFYGNIKLFNSNDGLTIFDDNNSPAVTIQKSSIGTFGASQNTTTTYNASAGTYTYVIGNAVGSSNFRAYLGSYDTSNGFVSETNRGVSPLIFRVGRCTTGNVLNFNNIKYTITGDNNSGWNDNINDYKAQFQLYWLNSDHIVKDTGWITPTRNSSTGEFSIPNQSYTVNDTDGGSGYEFTVLIYLKGPNGVINGTQNKHIRFAGSFTISKTVSTNTKIGTDGMYSINPNGEFWTGNDNIGMFFKNTGWGMYGNNMNVIGHNVTSLGGGLSVGNTITTLSKWDNYGCLRINGTTSDTIANRLLGEVGWFENVNGMPKTSSGQSVAFFNYRAGAHQTNPQGWPHPKVLFITGMHSTLGAGVNYVINLEPDDNVNNFTPAGQEVIIYNHMYPNVFVCAGQNNVGTSMSANMYCQNQSAVKYYVQVNRYTYGHFISLGNGQWLAVQFSSTHG